MDFELLVVELDFFIFFNVKYSDTKLNFTRWCFKLYVQEVSIQLSVEFWKLSLSLLSASYQLLLVLLSGHLVCCKKLKKCGDKTVSAILHYCVLNVLTATEQTLKKWLRKSFQVLFLRIFYLFLILFK